MIKYNETYSINEGQGTIVFKDAGNSKVEATYEIKGNKVPGNVSGKLEGNILKSIYQVNEAKGLMDFTFSENGFEAKWKKGVEEGPMKGKWIGKLINKTYTTPLPIKIEEKNLEAVTTKDEKKHSEKTLELNKLEAKETELAKKNAPPVVVDTPQIVETPIPAKVFKFVNIKITNVTKVKTRYLEYNAEKLIVQQLPQIGVSNYYTLKFEILEKNYRLTKGALMDWFSQYRKDTKFELIEVYKDDSLIDLKAFIRIILLLDNYPCAWFSLKEGKPHIHSYYSFKISIISIE